jgi:hypothetical protein
MLTKTQAIAAVGGLSAPSKMPCRGWSIPASACKTGGKLRSIPGSTCSRCYALKGRYAFPNVQNALERRLKAYKADPVAWTRAMIAALEGETLFRWFDSGDLQGLDMLRHIAAVAHATPNVRHWLPTREAATVSAYRAIVGAFPPNLTVRVSLPMIDVIPKVSVGNWSGVSTLSGVTCPAPKQGGKCLDCRQCWNASVRMVVYAAH